MTETRHEENLRLYLQELLGPSGEPSGLEGISSADIQAGLTESAQDSQELDDALQGLENFRADSELTPGQATALEAIILPRERPVVDVLFDEFDRPPVPWRHLGDNPNKSAIEEAILSVGRVEIPNHPTKPYGGTAFVVGENLLMTNRHVAETFTTGVGVGEFYFIAGRQPGIDFEREVRPTEPDVLNFSCVKLVHPWWDCALIEVIGLPAKRKPLALWGSEPDDFKDTEIVVVGYPARDDRNDLALQDRLFRHIFDKKRLQPGRVRGVGTVISYDHQVEALRHDSSTLGGNSGSLLFDFESKRVAGLHFGGTYLKSNFAVPTWELARDPRVVDAGVRFENAPSQKEDPWAEAYRLIGAPTAAPPESAPRAVSSAAAGDGLTSLEWFEHSSDASLKAALDRDLAGTRARLVEVLGVEEADELIADLSEDVTEGIFGPKVDPDLPEIIYLHGIMGSHLANLLGFGWRVWFSATSFARGDVAEKLRLKDDGLSDDRPGFRMGADGHLNLKYGKAARKWRKQGFAVHDFSYDWRKPIAVSANRLGAFIEQQASGSPDRKFALVAHSMGGLVSSIYAATHDNWEQRIDRAVFVGSPLGGSYAPLEAVLGVYPFFKTLAILSRHDGIDDLQRLAPTLPGLMQMLPDSGLFPNDPDYFKEETWNELKPLQKWLDLSRVTKPEILNSPILPHAAGIVASEYGTVAAATSDATGLLAAGPRTAPGDGTVPLKAAAIDQLGELWRATGHRHADLMNNKGVISAVAALVQGKVPESVTPLELSEIDFDIEIIGKEAPPLEAQALEALRKRVEEGTLTAEDLDWIFEPLGGDPPQ